MEKPFSFTALRITLGAACLLFGAFSLSTCAQSPKDMKTAARLVKADKELQDLLGDSVCAIMFSPSAKMKCHRLSKEKAGDNELTIGGYKVVTGGSSVSRNDMHILQFLLSDAKTYMTGLELPSVPFLPEVAVEFVSKKASVALVISFAGGQYTIVYNGKSIKTVKFTNERAVMLFFQRLLNDKNLAELLNVKN